MKIDHKRAHEQFHLRGFALRGRACIGYHQKPGDYVEKHPAFIVSHPQPTSRQPRYILMGIAHAQFASYIRWPVVEEWTHRLREKRLIGFSSTDARGGIGGVFMTELGKMLVEWTIGERAKLLLSHADKRLLGTLTCSQPILAL
jgi:hypothetical protein